MKQKVGCLCGWIAFVEDRAKAVAAGREHLKACKLHVPVVWFHLVEILQREQP